MILADRYRWHALDAVPDFLLGTLETYLPKARLYADARSYGNLRHEQNAEMSGEVLELARRLTRLFAYPLLHSFTTSAIVPSKATEGHDSHPISLDFLKSLICQTPSLRELDLTLERPQDRPHFAFEDDELFPPLESLRLDFSHIFHGQSHVESLELWANHMDWTALKVLKLEAVSQTQSLAICNTFQGKLPNLKELSIVICGAIGPIDIDLVWAWERFLEPLEKLESLSLIADFPNLNHWPSMFRIPRLRRLTHRLPESFLVSRYPLLASGNLFKGIQGSFNMLESLSIDADLTSHQTWQWAKFDAIARLPALSELDIRTHLSAKEFTVMDPQEAQSLLTQLFRYISARKVKRKLHSIRGTFRMSTEHLPGYTSIQKVWQLRVRCSLPDRNDEIGTVKTRIEEDELVLQRLTEAVEEHRRKIQTEHNAKRRRSSRPSESSECSIEHSGPLIDILRSETWRDRTT